MVFAVALTLNIGALLMSDDITCTLSLFRLLEQKESCFPGKKGKAICQDVDLAYNAAVCVADHTLSAHVA